MTARLDLMLVDDDPCERIFYEDALEEVACGYTLAYAESGADALAQLETARPAVMILDLRMPGLSGFDVLKAVRERRGLEAMKIYMVSNSMIESDRVQAMAMGAQGYRVKPVSVDGYAELVDAVCALAGCEP